MKNLALLAQRPEQPQTPPVRLDPDGTVFLHQEPAGTIDGGVLAFAFDGDDALCVATGLGTLLLLDAASLDELAEVPIADLTPPVRLSWRADGAYVALLADGHLTVLDRDLEIHSTGAERAGPHALAWSPNGALIACASRDGEQVVFFERNGLRRGEFAARCTHALHWSCDSELLAVDNGLWHRTNYQWTLKLAVPGTTAVRFDAERAGVCRTDAGDELELGWTVCASAAGSVAVVDGARVRLTHLHRAMIPPPMCAETREFAAPVSAAAFSAAGELAVLPHADLPGADRALTWLDAERLAALRPDHRTVVVSDGTQHELPAPARSLLGSAALLADGRTVDFLTGATLYRNQHGQPDVLIARHITLNLATNHLFLEGEQISHACGSAAMLGPFLLFTELGREPTLHFLHETQLEELLQDQRATATSLDSRAIERGARIVAAFGATVVLQMPRGNLEAVAPRALTLAEARRLLDAGDYAAALALLRRHRVDLNFLVDHNRAAFLRDVAAVAAAPHVGALVSALHAEDVAKSKYPPPPWYHQDEEEQEPKDLTQLLAALRGPLQAQGNHRAVLATYCREEDLDAAMVYARDHDLEAALADLVSDTALLVRTALATYDLALFERMARLAQQDPREYKPLLARLQAAPDCRFLIDDHLGRHAAALGHLDDPERVLAYAEQHQLQELALERSPRDAALLASLGRRLLDDDGRPRDAADAFLRAGLPADAVRALVAAGAWREALLLDASAAPQLAEGLLQDERYADAAVVLAQHCGDAAAAVDALLAGELWLEAARLAPAVDDVRAAAVEAGLATEAQLQRDAAELAGVQARLDEVLEQRRLFPLLGVGAGQLEDNDAASVFSDSSVASTASRVSTASSTASSSSSVVSTGSSSFNAFAAFEAPAEGGAGGFSASHPHGQWKAKQRRREEAGTAAGLAAAAAAGGKRGRRGKKKKNRIQPGSQEEVDYLEGRVRQLQPDAERVRRLARALLVFGEVELGDRLEGML